MKDFKTLTEAEYRAYPAESYSSIKHLLDSPATFLYYKDKPFLGTDSTVLGTAVHHYFQGNRHLVAFNKIKRTSKERKEEFAKFEAEFKELAGEEGLLIPARFESDIESIMLNFNENTKVQKFLAKAVFEEPFIFELDKVKLKGKLDLVKRSEEKVGEIKTSSKATTASEFQYEAYDRDYDLQAFLYLYASGMKQHYFVVANTVAPFKVSIYKSSEKFLESGRKKAEICTARYIKHIVNGEPYVDEGIEEI